jgi:hypothetical protein
MPQTHIQKFPKAEIHIATQICSGNKHNGQHSITHEKLRNIGKCQGKPNVGKPNERERERERERYYYSASGKYISAAKSQFPAKKVHL